MHIMQFMLDKSTVLTAAHCVELPMEQSVFIEDQVVNYTTTLSDFHRTYESMLTVNVGGHDTQTELDEKTMYVRKIIMVRLI